MSRGAASSAGQPEQARADAGPVVCSCFGVGRNTICAAIREEDCARRRQVGYCLRADPDCESCLPELTATLNEHPLDVSLDHAHCLGRMRIAPWIQQTQQVRRESAHPGTLRRCRSAFNVDCTYWWNSVWRKSTRDPRITLLWNWFCVLFGDHHERIH
jgi:NAD(P)H-nitrite reductase large subunit